MSPSTARTAVRRTSAIGKHMMSTTSEATVLFESNNALRRYILNRPGKLNALDDSMLNLLRPKIQEWASSDLCGTIVGTGEGRAFCAGGDVTTVVQNASSTETRPLALDFFKKEFELDYMLAALKKPYVVVMDGITMGGGVGLSANALFRVATEKTVWAMPETKIGYTPDVGASYFLSRMDGQLGTYLGLTGDVLTGREVFEHGLATHYLPSRRIPLLLERLAELDRPSFDVVNRTIDELSSERDPSEPPSLLTGGIRTALDAAFRHDTIEAIYTDLNTLVGYEDQSISQWASKTLKSLDERSPTSLKVALHAVRKGKKLQLREAMEMELNIAGAFCSNASPDFSIGVESVLNTKSRARPEWQPSNLEDVKPEVLNRFFDKDSPYLQDLPKLEIPKEFEAFADNKHLRYALPTEAEIAAYVRGSHASSGDFVCTADDVVAFFEKARSGKIGVREKVKEVIQRKCEVDNAWLKWID